MISIFIEQLKSNQLTLYIDLDGVLTDFDSQVTKFGFNKLSDPEHLWTEICFNSPEFWATMDWIPGSQNFWNEIQIYDPIILSAYPSSCKDSTIKGKYQWIKDNISTNSADSAILCSRKEKQEYANNKSILVDDYDKNLIEFKKNNGKIIKFDQNNINKVINNINKMFS